MELSWSEMNNPSSVCRHYTQSSQVWRWIMNTGWKKYLSYIIIMISHRLLVLSNKYVGKVGSKKKVFLWTTTGVYVAMSPEASFPYSLLFRYSWNILLPMAGAFEIQGDETMKLWNVQSFLTANCIYIYIGSVLKCWVLNAYCVCRMQANEAAFPVYSFQLCYFSVFFEYIWNEVKFSSLKIVIKIPWTETNDRMEVFRLWNQCQK